MRNTSIVPGLPEQAGSGSWQQYGYLLGEWSIPDVTAVRLAEALLGLSGGLAGDLPTFDRTHSAAWPVIVLAGCGEFAGGLPEFYGPEVDLSPGIHRAFVEVLLNPGWQNRG